MIMIKRAAALVGGVLLCVIALSSCTRMIRSPADELQMYRWSGQMENGNRMELSFHEQTACFTAQNEDFSLKIEGVCLIDDTTFVICDTQTKMNYDFSYLLHGDCVELTHENGTVELQKIIL